MQFQANLPVAVSTYKRKQTSIFTLNNVYVHVYH